LDELYHRYRERYGFWDPRIQSPPPPDLRLLIVLPCFNEPDLIGSLESLYACERPGPAVEVIVVVNGGTDCSPTIRQRNEQTLRQGSDWARAHNEPQLTYHFIHAPDLPARSAGVGLARKIGMDEAAARFASLGRLREGVIACFDADCRCDPNYLKAVVGHFDRCPRTPGCGIYFEHPLEGELSPSVYEAILLYELHLRYYVQALRYAGFPYAFHTVGSSMAVRAGVYLEQGGMNKRQAGEDFYFLQKVIPLGGYTDLTTTRVIPSPRPSDRVPFGTGRAVQEYLKTGQHQTDPLEAMLDLKTLFASVPVLQGGKFPGSELERALSPELGSFLQQESFASALEEIQQNTSTSQSFERRFFRWFNGFRVMKCVHWLRDRAYGPREVTGQSARLLRLLGAPVPLNASVSPREFLLSFRDLDRNGIGSVSH
jgi:cellulose synthase/poly-beta-1,6-N-acetylglucosamine synthase-like glycosyltransferase